jgi:SAM-dependent methyltransferase
MTTLRGGLDSLASLLYGGAVAFRPGGPAMHVQGPYAPPRLVTRVEDCDFYHTIDLPGHGCARGPWDLRRGVRAYLGGEDFAGKRVLDVGAASGFLSFHLESRGAEVVSYDLSPEHPWDIVPFAGRSTDALQRAAGRGVARYNNSYWLAHRLLGSRARLAHGTVYAIPDGLGRFDAATCGSILLHLRDPFAALHNVCRLTRDTVVVADMIPRRRFLLWQLACWFGRVGTCLLGRRMRFLPSAAGTSYGDSGWWELPPALVCQFLHVLGFADTRVSYHTQLFHGATRLMFTVVGRRTSEERSA